MNLETQARAKYTDPLLVAGKVGNMLKIRTKCCSSVCCCLHILRWWRHREISPLAPPPNVVLLFNAPDSFFSR